MACIKCGVPLVKADRGNIQLGNPDGFEHINCSESKYISKEMAKEATKKAKKEFPILPPAPVKEKKVEAVPEYTAPVEKKEEPVEEKPKWAHRFLAKEEKIEKDSEETSEESEE